MVTGGDGLGNSVGEEGEEVKRRKVLMFQRGKWMVPEEGVLTR
jgi:hypothetical protein